MHTILVTWPIGCYSYSYCVDGSGICSLILCCMLYLHAVSLDHYMISTKNYWAKLLSISLPSSCRGHPSLAKYCTVWATFSRHFLLDAFSLACAIWIVQLVTYVTRHGHFLAHNKSPQQLDCEEKWVYTYRMHQFSQNDHSSSIGLWIPLLMNANARVTEILP